MNGKCRDCGHWPVSHNGGRGGPPASGPCVALYCNCRKFVPGKYVKPQVKREVVTVGWYEKAVEAANRIELAHTSPWKAATVYALLSIAESLDSRQHPPLPIPQSQSQQIVQAAASNGELLTTVEVAEMARLPIATLRWWRATGETGPKSFKLGRRVMYRRADVEQWLSEAADGA